MLEVIAMITILGILSVIAVPSVIGIIEKSNREVCYVNVQQLKRKYETYLVLESMEHLDVVFAQYLQNYGENLCPMDGEISCVDGKVQCSLHSRDGEGEDHDDEDEGVPFCDSCLESNST